MKKPLPRRREIKRFELRRRSHHQDAERGMKGVELRKSHYQKLGG